VNDVVGSATVVSKATRQFHRFEEFNTVINIVGIDSSGLTDKEKLS
jgi:hypothetical protein